jgi:hypothetical protein
VTRRDEFRRVKLRAILIRGMDDVDKLPHRHPEEALDLDMATRVVRRLRARSAAILGIGVVLFIGFCEPLFVAGDGPPSGPVLAFLSIGTLTVLPSGLVTYPRWARRVRSLERAGWRGGVAELFMNENNRRAELHVTFPSGETEIIVTVTLIALPFPAAVVNASGVEVWIGGDSDALTVLFGYGPFMVAAKPV